MAEDREDQSATPVADRAAERLAEARTAFHQYGLGFFLAGILVGALLLQIVYMALG